MLCESCRAGDPECHSWVACMRQADEKGSVIERTPGGLDSESNDADRCSLVYEVGFDEDQPYLEPRRMLVCEVHP